MLDPVACVQRAIEESHGYRCAEGHRHIQTLGDAFQMFRNKMYTNIAVRGMYACGPEHERFEEVQSIHRL